MTILLEICHWICQWKNFENQSIFGEVMGNIIVACFLLTHSVHIRGFLPWQNLARCKIHFTSKSCVCLHWQRYCTALQQRGQPNFAASYKEWDYGTFTEGATIFCTRPSRWASAHILVASSLLFLIFYFYFCAVIKMASLSFWVHVKRAYGIVIVS